MTDFQTAQRLWAPWRMDFIRGPKEQGCFLCRVIREGPEKDSVNFVVHRGRRCILLMNRYPYSAGHLLVATIRHEGKLESLSIEERSETMELTCLGARLLAGVCHPQGFNMGINLGAAAGAGLADHLHMHVVPRWEGDTNFMPVVGGVRVVPQALAEMHAALKAELARTGSGA